MSMPVVIPQVLLVDDNEIMREVWPLLLVPLGLNVITAHCGLRALDLARLRQPDVIVTDMMMPEMTGIDLFNILHADSVLRVVPIIFMTSGTFPDDRPCRNHWLNKDADPEQVAEKIRSLLT